jgi:hypothetical protein
MVARDGGDAMKTRRHVILFQERFAPAVARGTKPHTIRPRRKRRIRAGDTLDLRAWTRKPYRSKQRKLREVTCTRVARFELRRCRRTARVFFIVAGRSLYVDEMSLLAHRDGFVGLQEMIEWFERMHDLPFVGQLIEWEP